MSRAFVVEFTQSGMDDGFIKSFGVVGHGGFAMEAGALEGGFVGGCEGYFARKKTPA